jgi:nucleotide-binding universal stress UspA family protein
MKRILSCLDGSLYTESVCAHTAWAAGQMKADVTALHVMDPERAKPKNFSANMAFDAGDDLLKELVEVEAQKNRLLRARGKQLLDKAARYFTDAGIPKVQTEFALGPLVDRLIEFEEKTDLVIIGKRGEAADFAKLHLGSNLERVLRASIRPVLVAAREFKPIDRFLLAYDGGPSVEKAVRFLEQEPLLSGAHCTLLRAGKIDDKAKWFLEEAGEKLRRAGYTVDTLAEPGTPEEVISRIVQQKDIRLLIMGAYGHSRVRNMIIGSTTTHLIRTCQVPVLLFR